MNKEAYQGDCPGCQKEFSSLRHANRLTVSAEAAKELAPKIKKPLKHGK